MARIVERDGLGVVAAGFAVEDLERELMRLTPDRVDAFKRASDGSARDLSAEAQSEVWREQFGRLLA